MLSFSLSTNVNLTEEAWRAAAAAVSQDWTRSVRKDGFRKHVKKSEIEVDVVDVASNENKSTVSGHRWVCSQRDLWDERVAWVNRLLPVQGMPDDEKHSC